MYLFRSFPPCSGGLSLFGNGGRVTVIRVIPQDHRGKAKAHAPDFVPLLCVLRDRGETIDGAAAQLTLMEIETPLGKGVWRYGTLRRIFDWLPKSRGWPADGERASICRPMPCHRRIDEFFDGLGNCAMIGSVRDVTFGSGESRIMLEYVVPIKAPFESQLIRTLSLWPRYMDQLASPG